METDPDRATDIERESEPANERDGDVAVFLLKARVTPTDPYEEALLDTAAQPGFRFAPRVVPVMHHQPDPDGVAELTAIVCRASAWPRPTLPAADHPTAPTHNSDDDDDDDGTRYGGLIFTSQRAVDVFADVVARACALTPTLTLTPTLPLAHLRGVPVYCVGPATARAVRAIALLPGQPVFGDECGNGATLAGFVQTHYPAWHARTRARPPPPLLFPVGVQHHPALPRCLAAAGLRVTVLVVYRAAVATAAVAADLRRRLRAEPCPVRWLVLFSPAACAAAVAARADAHRADAPVRIATIGPTTRDELLTQHSVVVDVCAATPSPRALLDGIVAFMASEPVMRPDGVDGPQ